MRSYPVGPEDAVEALQEFVDNFTYLGIFTVRWLGLAGLLALAAMLVVGVWRWHRRVGKERLDEESTAGHSPPP